MNNEVAALTVWAFIAEAPIPQDIYPLLAQNEPPIAAFKSFRGSAVFTNKRMIVRDAQGLSGKKVETYSLPYSAINM